MLIDDAPSRIDECNDESMMSDLMSSFWYDA
jgi:hypothetical protein